MQGGSTQGSSSSSASPRSDGVPAIFLSHSGKQKPFAENLFNALRLVNHDAFLDTHTLPKAEKFPENIKKAARGCELGVVVLSEDFLISKWPMIELEILVLQRGREAKVLPLFYKLTPKDLNKAENLSRWRQAWEKFNVTPDELKKWEQALRTLRAFNGERFTDGTSESSYINKVVQNICKKVPSPLLEDLSPIKGLHRLAEKVAWYFDTSRQCDDEALLVGLHGVGGLGKTTICKIMANFYNAEYYGRCYHLEFPTSYGGEVVGQIVQDCKNALKQLTNLSNELLNNANNFDKVIGLMKVHLRQSDVFLAIDNVWEESSEAAKRILEVGFSANSKILLTSRSEQVLEDVLDARSNVCVGQLPAVNRDEAFQIFQDAFGKGSIDFLESCREQVDRILAKFLFYGDYHALAMKALGGYVKKGCKLGDLKEKKEFLSRVAEQVENKDLGTLEKVIRTRYDILPEPKKSMFLDIAVILLIWEDQRDPPRETTYEEVNQWLTALYHKDGLTETKIITLIYELAENGLVQLNDAFSWGEGSGALIRVVRVHDLYSDLARREAATSSRFFISGNSSLEQIEWKKLERVVLHEDENSSALFVKEMLQQECKRLQVLFSFSVDLTGIDMRRMPSLCFLYVRFASLGMIKDWSAAPYENNDMPKRKSVWLSEHAGGAGPHHDHIPGVGGHLLKSSSSVSVLSLDALIQLRDLNLHFCRSLERIDGLDSLKNLETLSLEICDHLESLDGLSALHRLKALHIMACDKVKRLPDLSRLTCLEELALYWNECLEKMEGASPPALKSMEIKDCPALKSTPDLSGSTVLESLKLGYNTAMKERGWMLSSSLTELYIRGCPALETRVNLSGLTRLDKLILVGLYMEEELGALSSTVRELCITRCDFLKRVPDLSGLTRLYDLQVHGCSRLQVMPDISGLTGLQILRLESFFLMPDISGQYASSLRSLKDCVQLREVAVSHDAIAHVASSALPNMRKLKLSGGTWPLTSKQRWESFTHLEHLTVSGCFTFRRMDLACLSPLVNLMSLTLHRIANLEEIANSGKLKGLQRLKVHGSLKLKKLDGYGGKGFRSCVYMRMLDGYEGQGFKGIKVWLRRFHRCFSDDEAYWRLDGER